jgi:uncharacterized membrane protein
MSELTTHLLDDRIVAVYDDNKEANDAKAKLSTELNINTDKIDIVAPKDKGISEKLEGKSSPIGKQMLTAHFLYSIASFLLGMLIALLLVSFGPALFANNPLFTFIAFVSPGIFMGIFYGGLRSLKPERDPVNQAVVQAKEKSKWTLLINTNKVDVPKQEIVSLLQQTNTAS